MSATIAIASAPMPPAPTPWMNRAARSCSIEPAAPQSMEPTVKIEIAVRYMRLRP